MREIKSFNNPPTIVKKVMEALMLIFGFDVSWTTVKKVIADKEFLYNLYHFDIETLNKKTMKKLHDNYISQFFFQPYLVEKVSHPCTAICSWIISIYKFYEIK